MNFIEYRRLAEAVEDYKAEALERAIRYIKSVRGVFRIVIGDKPSQYSASFGNRIRVENGEVIVALVANNNMSSIEAGVPLRAVETRDGDLDELRENEEKLEKFRKGFIALATTYLDDGGFAGIPFNASLFFHNATKIGVIETHGVSYETIPDFLLEKDILL